MFCKHIHIVENKAHMHCSEWVHDRPLLIDIPNDPYHVHRQKRQKVTKFLQYAYTLMKCLPYP